ncbi:hypothetical protein VP01_5177g3 [Puccinia sorghi]|uniref:Uncharacterized protein n=1 Tax=Puccinia sorghi TaxID=27349 RepID=A0A0L6UKT4_9BASI|nr:hypothetical protein VP01_5177g3 [Puccinia sorghi]
MSPRSCHQLSCKLRSKLQKAMNSPMGFLASSAKLSSSATLSNCISVHTSIGSTATEENKSFFTKYKWETNTELVSDWELAQSG